MRQVITCSTATQFMDLIQGLVIRGMTFEADYDKFTIKLLGGY